MLSGSRRLAPYTLLAKWPGDAEYCAEAIGALRARNGSSYQAIEKYITANHPDVDFKRHHFRSALARGVETGGFLKIKASFKLDPSLKKRWYRRS